MIEVVNRHDPRYVEGKIGGMSLYIGRGTMYGNKASHRNLPGVEVKVDTREEAVEWYRGWLREEWKHNEALRESMINLATEHKRGNKIVLVCSCKPNACHGDVLKDAIEKIAAKMEA